MKSLLLRSSLLLAVATLTTVAASDAAATVTRKYTIAGEYSMKSTAAMTPALVDLDQVELERLLSLSQKYWDNSSAKPPPEFGKAHQVFQNGMHAGPIAKLTLEKPLEHSVDLPDPSKSEYTNNIHNDGRSYDVYELNVLGGSDDSYATPVWGVFRTNDPQRTLKPKTTTELYVNYPEGSTCNIQGATERCLGGPTGTAILQGYGAIDYTYDAFRDTKFKFSLKEFMLDEALRMLHCEQHHECAYSEYQNFYDYYGVLDYGNHWIDSAFARQTTNEFEKGNVDFSTMTERSLIASISTATVAMNVFTMVNRQMVEYALDGCQKNNKDFSSYGDSSSTDSVIASWDTAAAIYAGSALIGSTEETTAASTESGHMYYHMVQKLAEDFGVFDQNHRSIVNQNVLKEFELGRVGLTQADCNGQSKRSYDTIVSSMRVPWIQGVLKAAHTIAYYDGDYGEQTILMEEEVGRGTAFLAALLPDLHHCSREAADIVQSEFQRFRQQHTKHSTTSTNANSNVRNYDVVRDAIEEQYLCLGVTCDEVGGYLNPKTGHYFDASTRPCGGYGSMLAKRRKNIAYPTTTRPSSTKHASTKLGIAVISFFAAFAVFVFSLSMLVATVRNRSGMVPPVGLLDTASGLVSGAIGNIDYWLNSSNRNSENDYNYNYDVQLEPISRQQPNNGDERQGFLLL